MSSQSFSIGFRFYYWPYYKDIDVLPAEDTIGGAISYHQGYKISDLYMIPRYKSFGEEIMNYRYIDIGNKKFKKSVTIKAENYLKTQRVRKIKSSNYRTSQHYGIKDDEPLKRDNLISIILYTDTTELSGNFSSSFRKITPYETLSQVKYRNSHYYFWSKILRETVELYGERSAHHEDESYYSGISIIMSLPSFSIRLCSPTSTSVHIEVALKFSGEEGLILNMNMNDEMGNAYIRRLDVSYISKFKEEDERYYSFHIFIYIYYSVFFVIHRLFMGGYYRIHIISVRLISNSKNYESVMKSLSCLDAMMSGGIDSNYWKSITDSHIQIIKHLMESHGETEKKHLLDQYIYQTFDCFIRSKHEIEVNALSLSNKKANKKMVNLMMHPMERREYGEYKGRDKYEMTNLIKREFLSVFTSINKIFLDMRYNTISLYSLLRVIEGLPLETVIVQLGYQYEYDKFKEIYLISTELEEKYNTANFDISLKENTGYDNDYVWCIITRK